jgi:hypothetical protein
MGSVASPPWLLQAVRLRAKLPIARKKSFLNIIKRVFQENAKLKERFAIPKHSGKL